MTIMTELFEYLIIFLFLIFLIFRLKIGLTNTVYIFLIFIFYYLSFFLGLYNLRFALLLFSPFFAAYLILYYFFRQQNSTKISCSSKLDSVVIDVIIKSHLYAFYKQIILRTFIVKEDNRDIIFKFNMEMSYDLNKILINGIEEGKEICFFVSPLGIFLGMSFEKNHKIEGNDQLMVSINLQNKKFDLLDMKEDKLVRDINPSDLFAAINYMLLKSKN